MAQNVFYVILFCELIYACLLGLTILVPKMRVWPPPNGHSWQFYLVWTAIVVPFVATIWLAFLDWNNFVYDHWSRFLVGGFFMFAGYAIYHGAIDKNSFTIEQGDFMGRPSRISVQVVGTKGKVKSVKVGGESVIVAKGEFYLD